MGEDLEPGHELSESMDGLPVLFGNGKRPGGGGPVFRPVDEMTW